MGYFNNYQVGRVRSGEDERDVIEEDLNEVEDDEIEIDLLELLRKSARLMVILGVVFGTLAFVAAMLMPNEYTAKTSIYVLKDDALENRGYMTYEDLNVGQMLTNDMVTLIQSKRVKRDTADALGLEDLNDFKLTASSDTNTRMITLSVTSTDPEASAIVANTAVEKVSQMAVEVMGVDAVNKISDASVPTSPSGPHRLRITAIGVLAGVALALFIGAIRMLADTTVHSGKDVEELVGVPVIGHFPMVET